MNAAKPLTLVEEVVLLALDDQSGALRPMPVLAYSYVLAGALLSDLALAGRLDTDPQKLTVTSAEPTGDPLLDGPLHIIATAPETQSTAYWLNVFSQDMRQVEATALDRLVDRGVLRRNERKLLWVIGLRRYPTVDNHERVEVLTRLGSLILGNDLPEPRDAILLSLLTGAHLAHRIFTGPTYEVRQQRLATLAQMDLVGREVGSSVNAVIESINRTLPAGGM